MQYQEFEKYYEDGKLATLQLKDTLMLCHPSYYFYQPRRIYAEFDYIQYTTIPLEEIIGLYTILDRDTDSFLSLARFLVVTKEGIMDVDTQAEYSEEDAKILASGLIKPNENYLYYPYLLAEQCPSPRKRYRTYSLYTRGKYSNSILLWHGRGVAHDGELKYIYGKTKNMPVYHHSYLKLTTVIKPLNVYIEYYKARK